MGPIPLLNSRKTGNLRKWLLARYFLTATSMIPSVAGWSKALESDASTGGESPVRAPVRAAHFAPTRSGVCVCGRNRTEARERERAEGTVSSLPGTLNVRIKFCHSTGIARSGGGIRAGTTSYA